MRRGEEHHIEAKVVDRDLEKQELQEAKAMGLENSNLEVVSQGKEVKVLEQEARGRSLLLLPVTAKGGALEFKPSGSPGLELRHCSTLSLLQMEPWVERSRRSRRVQEGGLAHGLPCLRLCSTR